MRNYRLIAAPDSIASSKLRLYLRWKNIPFRETVATRQVIKSEITPRIKGVDVPLLITPSNETYQDTRSIIDFLEARERGEALVPERAELTFASRLLEAYADEWLSSAVSQLIWTGADTSAATRMARTLYPELDGEQSERIARTLGTRVRAKLARRGFSKEAREDTERQLTILLSGLERHLERSVFLLGDRPCIADFAIAAALTALRDSTPDHARKIFGSPRVYSWLSAVNGPGSPEHGGYRRAYGLPDTMIDLLRIAAAHFIPRGLEACDAVADWADSNPGRINLPKVVGQSRSDGTESSSELGPQSQFLLQRLLVPLQGEPDGPEQDALTATLEKIGCADLMDFTPRRTVRHEHFRMRVDLRINPDSTDAPDLALHAIAEPLLQMRRESAETRDLERLVVG